MRVPNSTLKRLSDEGLSTTQIAKETGMDRGHVARRLQQIRYGEREPDARVLRRQLTETQRANAKLQAEVDDRSMLIDRITDAIIASPPVSFRPVKTKKSRPTAVAVLELSDWHIGQKVLATQTEGFGGFNFQRAINRVGQLTQTFVSWVDTLRFGYNISQCVVVSLGDMINGIIHKEYMLTNEFEVPVQIAKAGELQAQCVRELAKHFEHVTLYCNDADNHSRMFTKPISGSKSEWSLGYLVNTITETSLANQPNVSVVRSVEPKQLIDILGWKFLCEHGDGVKAYMGIPWYGIERQQGREARRRMTFPERRFDYHILGHWHVPGIHNRTIFNGSLSGTTSYDHGFGRHSTPSQVSFLVSKKHGVFNFMAIDLD